MCRSLIPRRRKRQRTAALQNASGWRSFWSAAVLCRFSLAMPMLTESFNHTPLKCERLQGPLSSNHVSRNTHLHHVSLLMPFPLLYEINTRCWLRELSEKEGTPITLANVPDSMFATWQQIG